MALAAYNYITATNATLLTDFKHKKKPDPPSKTLAKDLNQDN